MKKVIYTLSFLTLISITAKSQTDKTGQKQDPSKKQAVQNQPAVAPPAATAPDGNGAKDEKVTEPKTRMAINEKGVPATKAAKDKAAKEEKVANPGQPATTEKK